MLKKKLRLCCNKILISFEVSQCSHGSWNDGTLSLDIPVSHASRLNLLDEDAELAAVLAL